MGLTKVTQAPGNRREPADEGQPFRPGQQGGIDLIQCLRRLGKTPAAFTKEHNRRHDDQRQHHDTALNKVGQTHRQETAHHGVCQNHTEGDHNTYGVIAQTTKVENAGKRAFEQLATGDEAGCRINREEDHDDDGRHRTQGQGLCRKTVRQERRDSNRIAIVNRLFTKTRGDQCPVEECPHEQTNTDPGRSQTRRKQRPGQTQEQPATHVRSTSGKRCHLWTQGATAQHIVLRGRRRSAHCENANGNHEREI